MYKTHWYVLTYVWAESCNRPLPFENPGQFEGKSGLRDSHVNFGTIGKYAKLWLPIIQHISFVNASLVKIQTILSLANLLKTTVTCACNLNAPEDSFTSGLSGRGPGNHCLHIRFNCLLCVISTTFDYNLSYVTRKET